MIHKKKYDTQKKKLERDSDDVTKIRQDTLLQHTNIRLLSIRLRFHLDTRTTTIL